MSTAKICIEMVFVQFRDISFTLVAAVVLRVRHERGLQVHRPEVRQVLLGQDKLPTDACTTFLTTDGPLLSSR
ncbi:hypothetical protein BW733_00890 [Tessaracoccus flavescens]|uniref:Uncharacterized protein n=1 Tax=Tessaracoccus flavescens TaxID=399497 RepID=A0A1Q2CU20_9ACTN|nr:hypothetical protein BW733_00890 [Tessaracoccus flavescens]